MLRAENNRANRPPPACKYIQRTEQSEPSLPGALRLPPPSVTQPPQLPLDVACAAPPASRRANLEQPQRSPCPKALPNPHLPAPPPVPGQGGADTMLLQNTCPSRNRPACLATLSGTCASPCRGARKARLQAAQPAGLLTNSESVPNAHAMYFEEPLQCRPHH